MRGGGRAPAAPQVWEAEVGRSAAAEAARNGGMDMRMERKGRSKGKRGRRARKALVLLLAAATVLTMTPLTGLALDGSAQDAASGTAQTAAVQETSAQASEAAAEVETKTADAAETVSASEAAKTAEAESSEPAADENAEADENADAATPKTNAVTPRKAPGDDGDDPVCKIGDTGYATLDEAVKAAADGDTITVLKDCTTEGLNLSKNLTIAGADGSKPAITFKKYGIALWSKSLTFKDCSVSMNGIGSTPYTAEWKWMTICAAANSSLTLDAVNMTMNGTGAGNAHAIYFTGNDALNIVNGSNLTIQNYQQDALEWNGGNGGYNLNIKDSTYTADHNRSGITGTFYATFDNSKVNVINSTGNGSNGSHYIIKNNSVVDFSNNGYHGLSAGKLQVSDSKITAKNNGLTGIIFNNKAEFHNSDITITGTKGRLYWAAGMRCLTANSSALVGSDTTLTITDNLTSGVFLDSNSAFTVEEGAKVLITRNHAEQANCSTKKNLAQCGGGITVRSGATANLSKSTKLYNNHAEIAGDDIYLENGGNITFSETGKDWKLDGAPDCEDAIDGWYDDAANLRWEAHAEDEADNYTKQVKAGTKSGMLALKAAHGLKPDPVDPGDITKQNWDRSKSKTATNLDSNMISTVTLSLPSAEKELTSDVVLVLDKSTSGTDTQTKATQMLESLKKQVEDTDAKVNVGVVMFNNKANVANGGKFFDLATQYDAIVTAMSQELHSGTNTHAGLLAGEKMLDDDTSVDASRKYLIFVSDAITYIYDEDPTCTAWCDAENMSPTWWTSAYIWQKEYGSDSYVPSDWHEWLSEVGGKVANQKTTYEFRYDQPIPADQTRTNWKTPGMFASSPDVALYKTYKEYQKIASKYHAYAVKIGTTTDLAWGPSFMDYLAGGETVSFEQIRKDISYLVDKGSYVDDYMGYVEDDYNFDLVDPSKITIKVGGETLTAEKITENKYGFGETDDEKITDGYRYIIEYKPGDKNAEEHFRWTTNVPVENFKPVQIIYQVKLTNPKTAAGTYGQYDRDGSKGYASLYTNSRATLIPVDSSGKEGAKEDFGKPTVSYTVSQPVTPVTPSDPAPVTVADPPVQKIVNGDKPSAYPLFRFGIAAVSTTAEGLTAGSMPMPAKKTVSLAAPGSAEFGDITFKKAGTYVYRITEAPGSAKGWTFDASVYTVTYVVTKSADGTKLICSRTIAKDGAPAEAVVFTNSYKKPATPDKPDQPDKPDKPDKPVTPDKPVKPSKPDKPTPVTPPAPAPVKPVVNPDIPKTGDSSDLPLSAAVLGTSAALLAFVLVRRRKQPDKI